MLILTEPTTPLAHAMRTRVGHFIGMVASMLARINGTKSPKTYEEQLAILQSRELRVSDEREAIDFLKSINTSHVSHEAKRRSRGITRIRSDPNQGTSTKMNRHGSPRISDAGRVDNPWRN